jgi:N-acetyl-alpha-D-muramate 1-phosphate uridylyltransferase
MTAALSPVCILAGGLGTRLGAVGRETPKALLEVAGRPFALWQLELLRAHGGRRVVMCVGHLGERIEAEIGSPFGLDVRYAHDAPELAGTAGAIRGARELLGERFLVLYGDTYLRIDYGDVDRAFAASGKPALMTVLRNAGRWDRSNVVLDDGEIVRYDKADPTPDMQWIDYGLGALTPAALEQPGDDLGDVYAALAERGELAAYAATERFYEIGTPDSLAETSAFLASLSSGSRRA